MFGAILGTVDVLSTSIWVSGGIVSCDGCFAGLLGMVVWMP